MIDPRKLPRPGYRCGAIAAAATVALLSLVACSDQGLHSYRGAISVQFIGDCGSLERADLGHVDEASTALLVDREDGAEVFCMVSDFNPSWSGPGFTGSLDIRFGVDDLRLFADFRASGGPSEIAWLHAGQDLPHLQGCHFELISANDDESGEGRMSLRISCAGSDGCRIEGYAAFEQCATIDPVQ
jgi:hypothetical protein